MGRSSGSDQEQRSGTEQREVLIDHDAASREVVLFAPADGLAGRAAREDRRASDVRVSEVAGRVARAAAECVEMLPGLTEEEIVEALLGEAAAITRRLRRGQATPAERRR